MTTKPVGPSGASRSKIVDRSYVTGKKPDEAGQPTAPGEDEDALAQAAQEFGTTQPAALSPESDATADEVARKKAVLEKTAQWRREAQERKEAAAAFGAASAFNTTEGVAPKQRKVTGAAWSVALAVLLVLVGASWFIYQEGYDSTADTSTVAEVKLGEAQKAIPTETVPVPVATKTVTTVTGGGGTGKPVVVATTTVTPAPVKTAEPTTATLKPVVAQAATEKKTVLKVEKKIAAKREISPPKKVAEKIASTAYLPMARKGEITSNKVLADRTRESLASDPSGNRQVRGANITPLGFLAAVKQAGGTVDGLQGLPAYLDNLIEREMPGGTITMSRVAQSWDANGVEKFTLDIGKGFARSGHSGEKGWYDANSGYLIIAGDCSNSPLTPTLGPVAALPSPVAPAPAPAPPPAVAQAPVPVPAAPAVCTDPLKMRLIVWDNKAYTVKGVQEMVDATRPDATGFFKPNRVSRAFGGTFRAMHGKGELGKSSTAQRVIVTHIRGGIETKLFEGMVTGEKDVPVPKDLGEDDVVKAFFPDSAKLVSPLSGDLRALGKEFAKGTCGGVTNVHAIEARK